MANEASGGIGLTGWVFLLFLGLKLGGVIDWSWWWVTAPLWIPFAIVAALIVLVWLPLKLFYVLTTSKEERERDRRRARAQRALSNYTRSLR